LPSVPAISVIIPVYDEEGSLPRLFDALDALLPKLPQPVEIVMIDDGSRDGSFALMRDAAATRHWLRVARLRRNFGQTAALAAAIDLSRAPVLVAMDADLQNDPEDVPALLARLDEGCDVVSGWRRVRKDGALTRRLPSSMANRLTSLLSGVRLHDHGCTLKAYRRWVLEPYGLYGEMHRFIPIFASWAGARVTELEVRHHARTKGRSKYGVGRTYKVLLDLLTLVFLGGFRTKPIYFFGAPAFALCAAGVLAALVFVAQFINQHLRNSPVTWVQPVTLLLLAVFLTTIGVYILLMGLLAELLMRTYFESQKKKTYLVGERVNFPAADVNEGR
jgi:glycosyltransferase involved in cell wall biosynthesis